MSKFTADIKDAVARNVLLIDRVEDDDLIEKLLIVKRTDHFPDDFSYFNKDSSRLNMEKNIVFFINGANENLKNRLKVLSDDYFKLLDELQLKDEVVPVERSPSFFSMAFFIFLLPFSFMGRLAGFLPNMLSRVLRKKTINNMQFWSPMTLVYSFINWSVYLLLIIYFSTFFLNRYIYLVPLLIFMLSFFNTISIDFNFLLKIRFHYFNLFKKKKLESLRSKRNEIIKLLPEKL